MLQLLYRKRIPFIVSDMMVPTSTSPTEEGKVANILEVLEKRNLNKFKTEFDFKGVL